LDKEFHYFEPVAETLPISRAVLVRYDADVHCVNTVLGDSLFDAPTIEKGTFFQTSQPYLATTGLNASGDHFHLEDLCSQPAQLATAASSTLSAHVTDIVAQQLVPLGLRDFLALLDLSLLPQPHGNGTLHASGVSHLPDDLVCTCWQHRLCVDILTDATNDSTKAFANVLYVLAALRASGLLFVFRYLTNHRTCLELTLDGTVRYLAVVDPFGLDASETELRLMPARGAAALDTSYIILGTKGRARRLVGSISPALAPSTGATNLGRATPPTLRAMYFEDICSAMDAGTVQQAVHTLLTAA
jgi:hypothetical protein